MYGMLKDMGTSFYLHRSFQKTASRAKKAVGYLLKMGALRPVGSEHFSKLADFNYWKADRALALLGDKASKYYAEGNYSLGDRYAKLVDKVTKARRAAIDHRAYMGTAHDPYFSEIGKVNDPWMKAHGLTANDPLHMRSAPWLTTPETIEEARKLAPSMPEFAPRNAAANAAPVVEASAPSKHVVATEPVSATKTPTPTPAAMTVAETPKPTVPASAPEVPHAPTSAPHTGTVPKGKGLSPLEALRSLSKKSKIGLGIGALGTLGTGVAAHHFLSRNNEPQTAQV